MHSFVSISVKVYIGKKRNRRKKKDKNIRS